MTRKEFISRPLFCTDGGVALSGRYRDHGCVVVPGGSRRMVEHCTADTAPKGDIEDEIAKIAAKLEKVIALMTKRIKAENAAPRGEAVGSRRTADQVAAAKSAWACAEAKAAYNARNPHRNDRNFLE